MNKKVDVYCPMCEKYRKMSKRHPFTISGKNIAVCWKCSVRIKITNTKKIKKKRLIKFNGCILVYKKLNRPLRCIACNKYLECLGKIAALDWAGWDCKKYDGYVPALKQCIIKQSQEFNTLTIYRFLS